MTPKPTKYRSVRTQHGGVLYDSRAESRRAAELDLLSRAGKIDWWLRQVPVEVGEPGVDRPYRVDFLVCEHGAVHAEDVKGVETASFRRHVRQWKLRGPFPLHIIKGEHMEIIAGAAKQ